MLPGVGVMMVWVSDSHCYIGPQGRRRTSHRVVNSGSGLEFYKNKLLFSTFSFFTAWLWEFSCHSSEKLSDGVMR